MVVKTAQVWTQSKIAREMLCFTIETAAGPTGGCGLCPRYVRARSQWQETSELAERKAMCGILLGNATADC